MSRVDKVVSRGRAWAVVFGIWAAVLVVGFGQSPASASHWLGSGYGAGPNDIWFHMCELNDNTHTAMHSNGDHDIGPTRITRVEQHGCDTVDVKINDYHYGLDNDTGWYECHDRLNGFCNMGHAHINLSYDNISEDYSRTLRLVCEEIGHSVGLDHRGDTDSCMSASNAAHLDAHDKEVINNHY